MLWAYPVLLCGNSAPYPMRLRPNLAEERSEFAGSSWEARSPNPSRGREVIMDYHEIEASLLSGFLRDRHLFTIALNEGFHADLMAAPTAKRLGKALFDLYGRSAAGDEGAVRAYLDDHGLLSPGMGGYPAA